MSGNSKMKTCRVCNAQIAKNAKTCPSCGAKNKKPLYKRVWFILLMLILGFGIIISIMINKSRNFDWNEVELGDRLPKPKSHVGNLITNESDRLYIHVDETSKNDYKAYIEECEIMGYIADVEKDEKHYSAFDAEGYALSLEYIGETMYIELNAPTEMGTLNWPKSEIASLLPVPNSAIGKVSTDTSNSCYIYVGETPIDAFNAYVDECSDYGFSVDYDRGDKYYHAKDANGNKLSLSYEGNNVMVVQIRKSDEVKVEETDENTNIVVEPEPSVSAETKGLRQEFLEAMDSYEAFMNEYCDFMKKYNESNGTDVTLLADYGKYMTKLIDVTEAFEAWEEDEMNEEELKYYLEVQTRINTKLINAGIS